MLYIIYITDRPMPFTNPLAGLLFVLVTCGISRITLQKTCQMIMPVKRSAQFHAWNTSLATPANKGTLVSPVNKLLESLIK